MTIANKMGKILPPILRKKVQVLYHQFRVRLLLQSRNALLKYDKNLSGWIVTVPLTKKKKLKVLARNFKELRRISQFGINKQNIVWHWLHFIENNSVYYDIGSANGLEGFTVSKLSNSHVCFIEPYTPSIETILKTIYLINPDKPNYSKFDVVHAACSDKDEYSQLLMHDPPFAGQTKNSFNTRKNYEERGGRDRSKILLKQWIKSISIDALIYKYKFQKPNYIKIDVDGYEEAVIKGAMRAIKNKIVLSWCIEITGQKRIENITKIMKKNGYSCVAEWNHYPEYTGIKTVDRIFIIKERQNKWQNFLKKIKIK